MPIDVKLSKLLKRELLELLYERDEHKFTFISLDNFKSLVDKRMDSDIPINAIKNVLRYLREKGFIRYESAGNDNIAFLTLTAYGEDIIEDEDEFQKLFDINFYSYYYENYINIENYYNTYNEFIMTQEINQNIKNELDNLLNEVKNEKSPKEKRSKLKKFLSYAFEFSKEFGMQLAIALITSQIAKS